MAYAKYELNGKSLLNLNHIGMVDYDEYYLMRSKSIERRNNIADKYISKILDIEEKEIRNQRLAMGMHQVWEPVHVSSTKDSSYY